MRTRMACTSLTLALMLLLAGPAWGEVRTETLRYGPITIGGYQTLRTSNFVRTPQVDGFVTAMDVHLVDARTGAEVPQYQVMLHHLVFTNESRHDGACPRNDVGERFYGTSEELRALSLPRGYGYRIRKRDRWRMIWMIMNHRHAARKVYVEYHVTVDTSQSLWPVHPYWVSVVPCLSDPQYTVPGGGPPGSVTSKRISWRVPISGRIVAMGGHLHGGSTGLSLTQPRCGHRLLDEAKPTYAPPGDPLYSVVPLLHEPDPVNVSWWQSRIGENVTRGEKLRLTSTYDAHNPHMRVMGIMHVYVAEDQRVGTDCGVRPPDVQILDGSGVFGGRLAPPDVRVPFEAIGRGGMARAIRRPPGRLHRYRGNAVVSVRGFRFRTANLSIPAGARVTWRFGDAVAHDATLVNGPRGFGTPWSRRGQRASHRFRVPGVYRVYCSIHPVRMTQLIRVRARPRR